MNDFDRDLERGLHQLFDPYLAEAPRAWHAPARGRAGARLLGGAGAALAAKLAMGVVVLAVATGVGTEAVITQSLNPVDWGRQVGHQLQGVGPGVQHRSTVSPGAHATSSAAAGRPASTPSTPAVNVPSVPAVNPPAAPTLTPPAVPSLSPSPSLPTVTPTVPPTVP